jgi:hypothetical protein
MRFGQLSNLGVFEAFDLATIVQWSKKIIVVGRWAFEVGGKRNSTFGHVEFKRNEWSKLHIQCHLQTSPKKKASYFLLSESSASHNPANFTFKIGDQFFLVGTSVTLSIAFLAPIGATVWGRSYRATKLFQVFRCWAAWHKRYASCNTSIINVREKGNFCIAAQMRRAAHLWSNITMRVVWCTSKTSA